MSFLDTGVVPNGKSDLFPVPATRSVTNYIPAADWNALCQCALDLRAGLTQAVRIGFLEQTSDPGASTGSTTYWWAKTDGSLFFHRGGASLRVAKGSVVSKGDVLVYNGADFAQLAVGSNGQVLTVDSSQSTGLKWAAGGSGGTVGLRGAYAGGGGTSDNIVLLTASLGPAVLRDNAVPIGTILDTQTNPGASIFRIASNGAVFDHGSVTGTANMSSFDLSASAGIFASPTGSFAILGNATVSTGFLTVSSGGNTFLGITPTGSLALRSGVAMSGTAVAHVVDSVSAWTSGDRLVSWRTAGVEKAYLSPSLSGNPTLVGVGGITVVDDSTNGVQTFGPSNLVSIVVGGSGVCVASATAWEPNIDLTGAALGSTTSRWKNLFAAQISPIHYSSQTGGTVTIAAQAGLGTGASASVLNGTDAAGKVRLVSGTVVVASSTLAIVSFGSAYASAPQAVTLTPANAAAAGLGTSSFFVSSTGTGSFAISSDVSITGLGSTTYDFYYQVLG